MSILLLVLGCQPKSDIVDYDNFNLINKRGAFQIYLPKYLYPDKKLYPKAAIAYCDSLNNTFFIIIREEIPDTEDDNIVILPENYHRFACEGIAAGLNDSDIEDPVVDTLNLVPALTSEIDGKFAGHKVFYTLTTLKTELYFFQLIGWTLYDYKSSTGLDLQHAAQSFSPVE